MMLPFLKYLDYANDICLFPHQVMGLGQIAQDLGKEISRDELKINYNKIRFSF